MRAGRLADYRITRFQFERDRPVGDSQIRIDEVWVAALELIDEAGRFGLGFAQSLLTPLPDIAGPSTTATVTLHRAPTAAGDEEIE